MATTISSYPWGTCNMTGCFTMNWAMSGGEIRFLSPTGRISGSMRAFVLMAIGCFFLEHGGEEAYQEKVNSMVKTITNERPIVGARNSTSDETYQLDIYYKGAYIMHSLRYILGDEVFFPMLQAFLSDEKYTYQNLVETKDFTDFVQTYSNRDLEDFFHLYLFTTDLPEVKVVKKRKNRYEVSFKNIEFALPMDVQTSEGIERIEISSNPIIIESKDPIQVDPKGWYLKHAK